MAHHKRKRRKKARAGCLMCKPFKMNHSRRATRMRHSDRKRAAVPRCAGD